MIINLTVKLIISRESEKTICESQFYTHNSRFILKGISTVVDLRNTALNFQPSY
nr:MAG TPA: hypothetical protein [Caudoviricetes sp.]